MPTRPAPLTKTQRRHAYIDEKAHTIASRVEALLPNRVLWGTRP